MYMAPERLLRVPADEIRCDIYSMGVTLFEALTLERPIEIHEDVALPALPTFLATPRCGGRARSGRDFPRSSRT